MSLASSRCLQTSCLCTLPAKFGLGQDIDVIEVLHNKKTQVQLFVSSWAQLQSEGYCQAFCKQAGAVRQVHFKSHPMRSEQPPLTVGVAMCRQ